ncbi:uncharacterized protein SPAPADRAFT_60616, partial [Spathaspora passalidarum NRRL Y-27907]
MSSNNTTSATVTATSNSSRFNAMSSPDSLSDSASEHEALVSAAEALTRLTRSATPSSDADTIVSESLPSPTPQPPQLQHPLVSTVSMVAQHPLVKGAVKYYETSKRNCPPLNYAAGIFEKAAIPMVNKIEVNLNNRHQTKQALHSASSSADITPSISIDTFDNKQKKRRLTNDDKPPQVSDNKKRLQFCLHVLRLANDTINSKVNYLQEKVVETEMAVKEEREKIQQNENDEDVDTKTQKTKTEIVTTVKKIIRLISNFRPSTLSTDSLTPVSSNTSTSSSVQLQNYELKTAIRDIILSLPTSLQQPGTTTPGGTTQQSNDRIIVFAKESLEMISKLTNVFNDQLSKAESWVNGEEELDQNMEDVTVTSEVPSRASSADPEELTTATKRMKI